MKIKMLAAIAVFSSALLVGCGGGGEYLGGAIAISAVDNESNHYCGPNCHLKKSERTAYPYAGWTSHEANCTK